MILLTNGDRWGSVYYIYMMENERIVKGVGFTLHYFDICCSPQSPVEQILRYIGVM